MGFRKKTRTDGSTVYSADFYDLKGIRRVEKVVTLSPGATLTAHKRAEAKARALGAQRRTEVENGTWQPPKAKEKRTFHKTVDDFLGEYRPRSGSTTYYRHPARAWKRLIPDKPLQDVAPEDVERFKTARSKMVGPSTVRKNLVALSTFFSWCKRKGYRADNPAAPDQVGRPKEPAGRTVLLSEAQEVALLAECAPWLSRVVRWALYSGSDRADVLALTWRDVDEAAGRVFAPRTKTGEERVIILNATLRAVLAECKKVKSLEGGGKVFLGREGKPATVNAVKLALPRAYRRAGIEPTSPFKRLRHTFATRLAIAGGSEFAVMKLLGHATTDMAQRYVHLADKHLQELMTRLDGPRAGSSTQGGTQEEGAENPSGA